MKKNSQHPLIGKFFHSVQADKTTIEWQGTITAEVAPGVFLLQLFDWMMGDKSNQKIMPVSDMVYWKIYDSAEEMNDSYEIYSRRKDAQDAACRAAKATAA